MATIDRSSLDQARQSFANARAARLKAQADLASKQAALSSASRTASANSSAVQAARASVDQQTQVLARTSAAEKSAIAALGQTLGSFLAPDIPADVARLEASHPIVLLPMRIETRFLGETSELRVRVYPDEISADSHEPELAADELTAGQKYWATTGKDDAGAWLTLLQTYPAERAAWIVKRTDPSAPQISDPPKPAGWSRAVEARLLPDRFLVLATRGSVTKQAVGSPVQEPLALSVGPDTLAADQSQIGPDGQFKLDDAVQWTIDWTRAVQVGMGISLPLDKDDLALGFDRVIVLGLKTSLDPLATSNQLAALFDAQHYTRGLAFVKQGTPTSNALGTPAGFPPADPNGARSFAVERGDALDQTADCAGRMLQRLLHLPAAVFSHVDGADLVEVTPAQKMNRVLYSATLGYFLDQMMAPAVGKDGVDSVRDYFSQWVIPRGLASAFRVGRVPYGVLPATSIARWQEAANASPVHKRIAATVQKLRTIWMSSIGNAPHVGRTSDPDQDLIDVLTMDASARQVRVRRVLGQEAWLNLLQLMGWPTGLWAAEQDLIGTAVLGEIGVDLNPRPRIIDMNFSPTSTAYDLNADGKMVDVVALSETDPLGPRDYITWIQKATIAQLQAQVLPNTMPQELMNVLLFRFLRHAALTEYHWWTGWLLQQFGSMPAVTWREPELVGIIPGTEKALTPWQRFQSVVTLPKSGTLKVADFINGGHDAELIQLTGIGDYREALGALAPLPTAELDRLFGESLDAVSHRLDAWMTALAGERLMEMSVSRDKLAGCFVGGLAWVENLRPEKTTKVTRRGATPMRTLPGGYVHAPSMAHAATAAILRNAYLTHLGETDSPYAVDLSSARVRMGRFLLDSVRNGQPLGAVLGYLIERALHEQHAETLIDPIRQVAPLVANKLDPSNEPVEDVAARNVVDGLALRNKWKANQLFGAGGLPPAIPFRAILEAELAKIDDDIDAVSDLLLAESVHQIAIGSTTASGAGLDALSQGVRPPEPDVGRATLGGTTLTHRMAVVLSGTPSTAAGWPNTATPRAACEPLLDAWVGALLGDPTKVMCRVQYPDAASQLQTVTVSFDQLQLRPLDVLALAHTVATDPAASELDRRVLYAAFHDSAPPHADGASFQILYAPDPAWDRATTRSMPELIDLAQVVAKMVGAMRPLEPVDVVLPANADAATADAVVDGNEAQARTQSAVTHLQQDVRTPLANAIAAVPVTDPPTAPSPAQATDLRTQLRAAADFGIAAAFPAFVTGDQEGGVAPLSLLQQASSVLAEIDSRLASASAASDPVAQAQALFGRDFRLLTGFHFPAGKPTGDELQQAVAYGPALVGGDAHTVDRWVTQAVRVRDALGRWRRLRLLAEASGGAPASFQVAQLPHVADASWVALPPRAGETRPSGRLSLLLHSPLQALDLTQPTFGLFLDEWVETIPDGTAHTGVAFRYQDSGGEAAQSIIVAVPPTLDGNWSFDALLDIIRETIDNAKLRALDLSSLASLGQLLPAIYLASNPSQETIDSKVALKADSQVLSSAIGGP